MGVKKEEETALSADQVALFYDNEKDFYRAFEETGEKRFKSLAMKSRFRAVLGENPPRSKKGIFLKADKPGKPQQ